MPVYTYSAKDQTGQTVSGQVVAPNERMAASQVRELGFFPMRVRPGAPPGSPVVNGQCADQNTGAPGSALAFQQVQTNAAGNASENYAGESSLQQNGFDQTGTLADSAIGRTIPLGNRQFVSNESALGTPFVRPYGSWFERTFIYPVWTGVSQTQIALFYRQFASMLAAGMTMTMALSTLSRESSSQLRVACFHMNKHITAGGRLSEALSMFPHLFSTVEREMIAAAEGTGNLHPVMIRLSEYLEAEAALRRMVRQETFMPKVNFAASFLIPTLVIAVMQGAQAYFQAAVMPLLRILIDSAMVWMAFRYSLRVKPVAIAYDTIKSYLPYFGTTVRMLAIAKFARALSSLYSSGVLIPTAVNTAARTSGNAFLTWRMQSTIPAMMAGAGLTESFRRAGVFPAMFLSMLGTGEHTGSLDQALDKMAEFYEAESQVRMRQSVQGLNTLIFLIVAGIVGFEVIGFWHGYSNTLSGYMNNN